MVPSALQDSSPRARTVRQLRSWLAAGQPPAGERLPAEQQLADRLEVSRGTVRAALVVLEREGWVRGRLVLDQVLPQRPAPSALMANTVVLVSAHANVPDRYRGSGYSAAVDVGALDELHASGRALMALPPNGLDEAGLSELIHQRSRGVLVPMRACEAPGTWRLVVALREAGIPVVVNSGEEGYATCDRIEHDHAAGSRQLCAWLIAQGRRRIAFVTTKDRRLHWVQSRIAGADAAMRSADLATQEPVFVTGRLKVEDLAAGERFAARTRLFAGYLAERLRGPEPVDALLVASDGEVYPIAAALRLLGLVPQRDIALVGYDGYWESCLDERACEATQPLATVDKDNHRSGIELVRLLEARLGGQLPDEPQRILLPPRFITIPPA